MSTGEFSEIDRPDLLQYVFHPRKDTSEKVPEGITERLIPVEAEIRVGIRLHLAVSQDAPNILFFHGNGEIASDYDSIGASYNSCGFGFVASDYRGYGKSTGEPTVAAVLSDAQVVFRAVRDFFENEGRTGSLVLMGRSLGSVPAIHLAASHNDEIAALILDSAFADTCSLLERIGVPVTALATVRQNGLLNIRNIEKVSKPTLIIHGRHDQLIPLRDAELLMSHSVAKKKQFVVVPGAGHNDILDICGEAYFQAILDFVMGTRRKRRGQ